MVYYKCCANRGGSGALYPQSAVAGVNSPVEAFYLYGRSM